MGKIAEIQRILGVKDDDIWGPKTQAALDILLGKAGNGDAGAVVKKGFASSFADLADVRAFEKCKARGGSDEACFRVGDNGIGMWGDRTAVDTTAMVAVPPDDMIEKWGNLAAARGKKVKVTINPGTEKEQSVIAEVRDRMPWRRNIKNGAVIDMNPGTLKQLGLTPPVMVNAQWEWV